MIIIKDYELTQSVSNEIEHGKGFYLGFHLTQDELLTMRSYVEKQWIDVIAKYAPAHQDLFFKNGMLKYHENAHLVDHENMWCKKNRILPQEAVGFIRTTSLLRSLQAIYGDFVISNEENIENEEVYWRLVRPNQSSDIGPLHADAWFWELGHGVTPPGVVRVKVWVALFCDVGHSGLRLVPDSHKKRWDYHGEYRHGYMKPAIEINESQLSIELAQTKPGDAVVFHDRLLHGSAVTRSDFTRISMEFTMFVKNKEVA